MNLGKWCTFRRCIPVRLGPIPIGAVSPGCPVPSPGYRVRVVHTSCCSAAASQAVSYGWDFPPFLFEKYQREINAC